jgi:N-alpha-acetyltransferase 10/11
MKRPEFLMFALLRSSATALATTGEKIFVSQQSQTIQLRLATRTDVPAIQRCNLSCLPENYNSQFYCSHLRQWPELALVAEEVSNSDRSRNLLGGFTGGHQEPKIVAYLLGKVENRPLIDYDNPTSNDYHGLEVLGHVTSLAVQKEYRRLGLAKAMMNQLHHHLQYQGIQRCGLHVRTSNIAACRLYEDDDYQVSWVVSFVKLHECCLELLPDRFWLVSFP